MTWTTITAAEELGVGPRRIRALITSGRLKAQKQGRDWLIEDEDLEAVRQRRPGRPGRVHSQE